MRGFILFCLLTILLPLHIIAQEETYLLRFPNAHGNKITFSYAGHIYIADLKDGIAMRLTDMDGYQIFPRFSPNGRYIAFTGRYQGKNEVYVVSSEGGVPERLTYTSNVPYDHVIGPYGPNNIVMGWKNNDTILFRCRSNSVSNRKGLPMLVSRKGGDIVDIPLAEVGFCSFSPDGSKMAINRPFRDISQWKNLKGHNFDRIWIYDIKNNFTQSFSDDNKSALFPMWHGDNIFHLARGTENRYNLFSINSQTGATKTLSEFDTYDIRFPSLNDGIIAFENGGKIFTYNIATEKLEEKRIRLFKKELAGRAQPPIKPYIEHYHIAPDASKILLSANGDIFVFDIARDTLINLSNTPGVNERYPTYSPDGQHIAYIADKGVEDDIFIAPADFSGEHIQATLHYLEYRNTKYPFKWSPDSKKILWTEKKLETYFYNLSTGRTNLVIKDRHHLIKDFTWSPDSKWIAYSKKDQTTLSKVFVYSLEQTKSFTLTAAWYESDNIVFSGDGNFLYFSSSKADSLTFDRMEWKYAYPYLPRTLHYIINNEFGQSPYAYYKEHYTEQQQAPEKKGFFKRLFGKKDSEELVEDVAPREIPNINISPSKILSRMFGIDMEAGFFSNLTSVKQRLYYLRHKAEGSNALQVYDFLTETETFLGYYDNFIITEAQSHILAVRNDTFFLFPMPLTSPLKAKPLNIKIPNPEPAFEARRDQLFNELNRLGRDFFYDRDKHNYAWGQHRVNFEDMIKHALNYEDIYYIFGDMLSFSGYSSSCVTPDLSLQTNVGQLGARFTRHPSGYYKIESIMNGDSRLPFTVSPLKQSSTAINEGEFIIAVDGKPVDAASTLGELLVNKAGKAVELTLNSKPEAIGGRKIIVTPLKDEAPLLYYNQLLRNSEVVNKAFDGKVAYVPIPPSTDTTKVQIARLFLDALNKNILILDNRGNDSRFILPEIATRINAELKFRFKNKHTNNNLLLSIGPKLILNDRYSSSDGDIFMHQLLRLELARNTGGYPWGDIFSPGRVFKLTDGSSITTPDFNHFNLGKGDFIYENFFLEPDIFSDNSPEAEYKGIDRQLQAAIQAIKDEIKNYPDDFPIYPPFEIK